MPSSNRGNLKLYPLALRYFSKPVGTKNRVIDFYTCPEETSDSISSNILARLEQNQMNIQYLVSYGADNAADNYGKYHSVLPILDNIALNLFLLTVTVMSYIIAHVLDVGYYLVI